MNKKRLMSLLVCGALTAGAVAGMTACGDGDGEVIKLTVWGSAAQQETFEQMAEEFKKANPDKTYDIKVGVCEENWAYRDVSRDPSAAADVYCYSNDQLVPLLRVGALARIGGANLDTIKADNSVESVKAGSIAYGTADEKVYGYPYASDNGYFMFYNKSIVPETDTATLEGVISACETAGKKIAWAIDAPWYDAGWFFAFGGSYSVDYDYNDNYKETNVEINFGESEVGVKASKAIAKLTSSKAFAGAGTNDSTIITGFTTESTAVAISGTWNAKRLQEILGDDYGVCKLPTVTIGGETKQLYSFKGYKLLGVNPHSENPGEAHKLAAFLSGEAMQKVRFENHFTGPTNKAAANDDKIKTDPTFLALNEQNAFAKEQTSVPTNFWEPLKNYCVYIMQNLVNENPDKSKHEMTYEEGLTQMVSLIKGTVTK